MKELVVYLHSEEDTFYKVLVKHYQSKGEVLHGEREYDEIEVQIESILESRELDVACERKFAKLKRLINLHVKEEGEIFKKAKKVLIRDQVITLKKEMAAFKKKILA